MPEATTCVQTRLLRAVSLFFEYDTPKIVHIRSKKVGVIYRLIQIALLAYIIGYAVVWEEGYQDFENIVSVSTTKVKGTIFTNTTKLPRNDSRNYRIWDVADYVNPPLENGAFFVTTNMVITKNQTQEACPEDPGMVEAQCKNDSDCREGQAIANGNGVCTGKCVPSDRANVTVCEIYAWCPVEDNVLPLGDDEALLKDSRSFTVLIKNNIEFPKFDIKRRNILDSQNETYLKACRYNPSHPIDRLCPTFELGAIVHAAGENYEEMAIKGGVISIDIHWECNLDISIDNCIPYYTMRRLDLQHAKIAQGWNFRYANFYNEDLNETIIMKRDLYKVYGIRFVIKTTGRAGKFSLVPLLLSIGSGMGLLAIATVLCDIIVMHFLKKGPFYRDKKYLYVTDDDAFQTGLLNDNEHQSYISMADVESNANSS